MRSNSASRLVDLGLLVTASVIASVSVSLAIEPLVLGLPQDPVPMRDKPTAQSEPTRLDVARLAALTALKDPATCTLTAGPVTLPLRLLGTLRGNDEYASSALLLDTTDSRFIHARIGDVLHDAVLIRVEHGKATFVTNGVEQTLTVRSTAAPIPPPIAVTRELAIAPRDLGNGRVIIPRSLVQTAMTNLPELAGGVRFLPVFPSSGPPGFRIDHLQPSSLFAQLGLKDGDVITRINGSDLSNLPALAARAQELFTVREVTVELIRDGQVTTRVVTIDG